MYVYRVPCIDANMWHSKILFLLSRIFLLLVFIFSPPTEMMITNGYSINKEAEKERNTDTYISEIKKKKYMKSLQKCKS